MQNNIPQTCGIVGYGRFGRALGDLIRDAGLTVRAFDPEREAPADVRVDSLSALARCADVLILAVPISSFDAVLGELRADLEPRHLVLDVGSVKVGPSDALERHLGRDVPWIATHPLFGPVSLARGERPLRVVVCPSEHDPAWTKAARDFIERIDCEVIEQHAEEHDRAMAKSHVLAFFVAKGLMDIGAGEGAAFTPPSYEAIHSTVEAVRADASHLFAAIQTANPFAAAARERLIEALSSIHRGLSDGAVLDGTGESGGTADVNPALAIEAAPAPAPDQVEPSEVLESIDRELVELLSRRHNVARRAEDSGPSSSLVDWCRALGIDTGDLEALWAPPAER